MTTHSCPYNRAHRFTICDKVKCPYHTHRSADIFKIDEATQCIKIDAPEIVATLSESSLSSIDRTNFARVNHRRIRRDIEETLALSKSIITIYGEVPSEIYCKRCGMIGENKCRDNSACNARLEWIGKAKQALCLENDNPVIYANIWSLLSRDKLYLNNAVLERHGRALLPVSVNKIGQSVS